MKERFKELGYWLEDRIKGLCGEITPDKRLTVILIMLLLFTVLNLYFTFISVRNWGREQESGDQLKIEHIEEPGLQRKRMFENLIGPDIEYGGTDSIFYKFEIERT